MAFFTRLLVTWEHVFFNEADYGAAVLLDIWITPRALELNGHMPSLLPIPMAIHRQNGRVLDR